MGNNFSSKYELFRNVKADDKKGLNKNYGIFLVLRRKTGIHTTHNNHHPPHILSDQLSNFPDPCQKEYTEHNILHIINSYSNHITKQKI